MAGIGRKEGRKAKGCRGRREERSLPPTRGALLGAKGATGDAGGLVVWRLRGAQSAPLPVAGWFHIIFLSLHYFLRATLAFSVPPALTLTLTLALALSPGCSVEILCRRAHVHGPSSLTLPLKR